MEKREGLGGRSATELPVWADPGPGALWGRFAYGRGEAFPPGGARQLAT